jgi:hypothetical protein
MCWPAGVRIPVGVTNLSLRHSVQTESGAHPAFSLRREADQSSPSSAEVKNGGAIPSLPHTSLLD